MLPFDTEQLLHQFAALLCGDVMCLCVFDECIYGRKKKKTKNSARLGSNPHHPYGVKIYTCVIQSMKLANNAVANL